MSSARSYAIFIVVCCVTTVAALSLSDIEGLHIPFHYLTDQSRFIWHNFDVNLYLAYAKGIDEGSGAGNLARMASGNGILSVDYPVPSLQPLIYTLLTILTLFLNWGTAMNALYLLSFLLAGLTANIALRERGIALPVAGALALIYAFLPFHTYSGQMHLALSFYFSVPLIVTVACWIGEGWLADDRKALTMTVGLFASFLAATTDPYFGFFGALTFFFATVFGLVQKKSGFELKTLIFGSILIIFPIGLIAFLGREALLAGTGVGVERMWQHVEFWGLKPIQLILPIRDHYVEGLRDFSRLYNDEYPAAHINESVSLGLVGSAGFLMLLWMKFADQMRGPVKVPAALLFVYLLYATTASLGFFLALHGLIVFRSLYRVVPFIAFLCLIPVGLLATEWWHRAKMRSVSWAVLTMFTLMALADVTGLQARPDFKAVSDSYRRDAAYFSAVEDALPPGSKVLQLPHAPFPEGGSIGRVQMYEQFIPYLHTQSLVFSFGTKEDTDLGTSLLALASVPENEIREAVCVAGFDAVLVDKRGYLPTIHNNRRVNFSTLGDVMAAPVSSRYQHLSNAFFGTKLGGVTSDRYDLYSPCDDTLS